MGNKNYMHQFISWYLRGGGGQGKMSQVRQIESDDIFAPGMQDK